MRYTFALLLLTITFCSLGQNNKMQIRGSIKDTSAKALLENVVIIAVRLNDSVLVNFSRSNSEGVFELKEMPIDTYQVVITHPLFADGLYIIAGTKENKEFDLGKIVMQAKTQQLGEVTVLGFRDPIYYKGDTLIYTADSFKVKPNATVEDLLKKLPGVRVDAAGKITTQGKTVEKVLVDGDEFFGGDPTVATRNLNATNIESVQVYDKKNEASADGSKDEETIKVMNLKLKEDAKKGYFGKASGASDFQKFYEGEFLANRFNKNKKISLFGLVGNTPRTNFNFGDVYKYGLNNEMNMNFGEDGNEFYYYNNDAQGLPRTIKSGIYYTDRINKKVKVLSNYSYNQNLLKASSETRDQYFLQDTTYSMTNISNNETFNDGHSANMDFNIDIDSLTNLVLKPKASLTNSKSTHIEESTYISEDNQTTRKTSIGNTSKSQASNFSLGANLNRKFKKKDRVLKINNDFTYNSSTNKGFLKTLNSIDTSLIQSNVDQSKTGSSENINNNFVGSYTEPITKKIKIDFMLDLMNNFGKQEKSTMNYVNGEYSQRDSLLSNNFSNSRNTIRPGLRFVYETKKVRFAIGSRVRNVQVKNENMITNQAIKQNVTNVLPFLSYRYKFSDNKNYSFAYYTVSNLPTINQLQPIYNNTNPNSIVIGNPSLLPSYTHHFENNFYSFKPISGFSMWSGISGDYTNNSISTSTVYDSYGRTTSQSINVNGNHDIYGWLGMSIPLFKKLIKIDPNFNANYSNQSSFVNNQKNVTINKQLTSSIEMELATENITVTLGTDFEYNSPKTTLNNETNKPYTTQHVGFEFSWQMPKGFTLETDGLYTINSKRSDGYNLNYLTWNASAGKKFLKNENLIVSLIAKDILNQNISAGRSVSSNVITDSKTTIIKRYFLLQLTYKFNSTKTKEEDNDWGM